MFAIGKFAQRKIASKDPENEYVKNLEPQELGRLIAMATGMGVIAVVYKLAPQSSFGKFIGNCIEGWYGWVTIPTTLILLSCIVVVCEILIRRLLGPSK